MRAARDLDLVPEPSAENLDRLAGTRAHIGAERSIDGALTGLRSPVQLSFNLRTRHGEVQIPQPDARRAAVRPAPRHHHHRRHRRRHDATFARSTTYIERRSPTLNWLRDPAAIAGWLVTTTRRESLRLLQAPVREQLTDDPRLGDHAEVDGPDMELLEADRRAILARALASLPDRHGALMTLVAADPAASYHHISATLSMPIGSIGPIRARSLARLQRHPELGSLHPRAG